MFSPLEHEEDGAQNLVANGDDRAFMAASDDQGLEFRFEDGRRAAGGMGKLTQQAAYVSIAFSHVTGFVLARQLVVAWAHACPRSETIGAAKDNIHIGANFNQQQGRTDLVTPRNRLQQGQGLTLSGQPLEQMRVKMSTPV